VNLTAEQIDNAIEAWEDNLGIAEQMLKRRGLSESDKAEIQDAITNAKDKLNKLSQMKGQNN